VGGVLPETRPGSSVTTAYPTPRGAPAAMAAGGSPPCPGRLLDPFDLLELELDRRRAAEDGDSDLHPAAVEIQFLDHAVEARERAVEHLDRVADLIVDADLGLGRGGGGLVLGVEDAGGLGVADRLGLAVGPRKPVTLGVFLTRW
jgi:hypothetical protein